MKVEGGAIYWILGGGGIIGSVITRVHSQLTLLPHNFEEILKTGWTSSMLFLKFFEIPLLLPKAMLDHQEKRKTQIGPVIGDVNRLRRKDDTSLKKKLLETVTGISQKFSYLSPVSEKEVEMELEQGHIRALVDDTGEIEAHVRCLPISDEDSFILTLHGKTTGQVVELLRHLSQAKTITLETVNKHLKDLGITEKDLLEVGFERTSLSKLGFRYVVRTNFYYFKNDPIKYLKGFFRKETTRDQFVVFIRRGQK